jgi:hypothetical protein
MWTVKVWVRGRGGPEIESEIQDQKTRRSFPPKAALSLTLDTFVLSRW